MTVAEAPVRWVIGHSLAGTPTPCIGGRPAKRRAAAKPKGTRACVAIPEWRHMHGTDEARLDREFSA